MLHYSTKEKTGLTIALPGGGELRLRPVTTPSFEAAKATARKKKAALVADPELLRKEGLSPEDVNEPGIMEAHYLGLLIGELGVRHITSWDGVADESGEKLAECTADNIRKLLKHPGVATNFYTEVLSDLMPDVILKKDLGTDAPGISAAVPITAQDAEAKSSPAPKDCPDKPALFAHTWKMD